MSSIFWIGLIIAKYLSLFSLKSIVLGLTLLINRFFIRLLAATYLIRWYSLLFFLIYIGGLLVLFIYISSLKFKPTFYSSKDRPITKILLKLNILLFCLIPLTQITWNFKTIRWDKSEFKKFRLNLFKEKEIFFLICIGMLLLIVLWVITKLSFRKRGALRPVFK